MSGPTGPKGPTPEQLSDLQAKLDDAIKSRDAAKNQNRDLSSRLESLEAEKKKRDDELSRKAKESEEEKLKAEGKYAEALELNRKELQGKIDKLTLSVKKNVLPKVLSASVAKVDGVFKDAVDDAVALLAPQVDIDLETFEIYPKGSDGKPLLKEGTVDKPVPLDEFVTGFVSKRPHLLTDKMVKGAGAKPGAGADSGGGVSGFSIQEWIKKGKPSKYLEEWIESDNDGYTAAVKDFQDNPGKFAQK